MSAPDPALASAKSFIRHSAPDAAKAMALFLMVVTTLYFGKEVLLPITLALVLAFILAPLVDLLKRLKLGRVPSVLLGVLLALGVIVAIGGVIGSQIADLTGDLPRYRTTIQAKISAVNDFTIGRLSGWADRLGPRSAKPSPDAPVNQDGAAQAPNQTHGASAPEAQTLDGQQTDGQAVKSQAPVGEVPPLQVQPIPTVNGPASDSRTADGAASTAQSSPKEEPHSSKQQHSAASGSALPMPTMTPMSLAEHYLTTVLSPLATLGIVFVVAVFALLQREDLRNRLIRLVSAGDLHHATVAIDDGGHRLSRYFRTQLIINTIFGIVIGIGLMLIGVPNPLLWAVLSGLLRFVPYVGAFISAAFPLAMAAAVSPGWTMVLWTAALYGIVEPITGQFIEPMVYGNSTGLSPFSVVVAAIFWSWVWGPVGLILSTPLTLCLVVIGRHVKRLEFLDVVLGDRPALTPVEIFYQRILADDPDEVLDEAETLLKDVSLSTYYDEVAVKGLQRAAVDTKRGVIDRQQLAQIRDAVDALIVGMERHIDKQPINPDAEKTPPLMGSTRQAVPHNPDPKSISPEAENLSEPWRHRPAVLCIAGRGPLDEPAAAILVQLLGKHGMDARLVPHGAVSRQHIATLDASGVAMACVCYLDVGGSPAHLRHLIERLRGKLPPEAPVLAGLWPQDDPDLKDGKCKTAIGADYVVSSLEQAVSTCADAARMAGHRNVGPQAA